MTSSLEHFTAYTTFDCTRTFLLKILLQTKQKNEQQKKQYRAASKIKTSFGFFKMASLTPTS